MIRLVMPAVVLEVVQVEQEVVGEELEKGWRMW